jgi:hypothetical protein
MRALSALELLAVWESGATESPAERALTVLAVANPEMSGEELAALGISRRDELLFSLREAMFGPEFSGVATCPNCRERLELLFRGADLRKTPEPAAGSALRLAAHGLELSLRPPNSGDLAIVSRIKDLSMARLAMLERCVTFVGEDGGWIGLDRCPDELVGEIEQLMADLDPRSDMRIEVGCNACGARSEAPFDVGAYLWDEINVWAPRILREVHVLASAYGWREFEILAMSPERRSHYLNLIAE